MAADVHLEHFNSSFIKVICDPSILMELSDHLTFYKDNYKFDPRFKARSWDGKIRLLNRMTRVVYAGLAQRIKQFCDSNDYTLSFDDELVYDSISVQEVQDFMKTLNLPERLTIREYQINSIVKCLRSRRRTLLSPTSSGKSFIIYVINEWYRQKHGTKSLVIVPTIGLVKQMEEDFKSYGYTGTFNTSIEGLNKTNDHEFDTTITTWQSLDNGKTKMPRQWYQQYQVVFGDEAHGAKATSLINIISSMTNTPYRFGTTGTLDNSELNKATIYGLFGAPYMSTTTRELIDDGYASNIKIKCIVLKYTEEERKEFHKPVIDPKTKKPRKRTYQEEIEYLVNHKRRTEFIKNLALSLTGNKLLFFRLTDHGDILHESLKDHTNVFYIDGSVKALERERIRKAIEEEENAILIASMGTTSTGVSINRLHHMIAASPSKSKIKVLQSIGRMLRQHEEKTHAVLYDIVDDLSHKKNKNFVLEHFEERAKIYDSEQFDYRLYTVGLK